MYYFTDLICQNTDNRNVVKEITKVAIFNSLEINNFNSLALILNGMCHIKCITIINVELVADKLDL